jgi:ubiquinone/menaquinone biosynthesis C-methylase UbiE
VTYATRYGAAIEVSGGDTGQPRNLAKRLDLIRRYCRLAGTAVLDCGCGEGDYVIAMLKHGADARGVEYERKKVAAFKARFPDSDSDRVRHGDIQRLQFSDNSFDLVLLNEVLEHIPNQARALAQIRRVLKPPGKLVLFAPNRLYPFETHGVYITGSDRRLPHYTPFIPYIPVSVGGRFFRYWARNYWPRELRRLIRDAGFDIIAKTYMWQTFEDISGNQPRMLTLLAPALRRVATLLEKTPGARAFGASQIVVAQPRA